MVNTYDEALIASRLATLDRDAKTAFAAACAQRLLPLFDQYARTLNVRQDAERLRAIVGDVWVMASSSAAGSNAAADQADAEGMVPTDDGEWVLEMGYGQNGAAAAAYAVRTFLNDDPQEAAWAARQVYEVADYAVLRSSPTLNLNATGAEEQVLGSAVVQEALAALDQYLEVAASGPPSWADLRETAEEQGRRLAESYPAS